MRITIALLMLPAALLAVSPGQYAPAFQARGLNGAIWSQKSPAKGYLLLDFWASWCIPCLDEIPALNTLQAEYRASGALTVLGLSLDKGGYAVVRAQAQRHGIAYAVAPVDPKMAAAYGVKGFPSAFLLRGGKVIRTLTGKRGLADFERDLRPYLGAPRK